MKVKRIFLVAIGFLFCLLLACQKEKSVQHGETGDVEYRFNFKVDSAILPLGVPEGENEIDFFNAYPSQFGDATAKIATEAYYGFVSDAPASYNQLKINGFTSDMFVYQNYKGIAGSQNYAPGGLSITSGAISFFRRIDFTLPIPAGVKSTQKVVYKMVINNIRYENQTLYDPPVITYEIVEQ